LKINWRALLANHGRQWLARAAAATAAAAVDMNDVDGDLTVVLNIDAVVYVICDGVVAAVYIIDYVALVAVDVAKVHVLLGSAFLMLRNRLLRVMNFRMMHFRMMYFRLMWFGWRQVAHASGLVAGRRDSCDVTHMRARNQAIVVGVLPLVPTGFPQRGRYFA